MKRILCAVALLLYFTASSFAADYSSVAGNYISKSDKTQILTLSANGTFFLKQRKNPPDVDHPFIEISGQFQIDGEKLILGLKDGRACVGKLVGNTFDDGEGDKWVKEGTEQQNVERPKRTRIKP